MIILGTLFLVLGILIYLWVYKYSRYEVIDRPAFLLSDISINLTFLFSQLFIVTGLIFFFIVNFFLTLILFVLIVSVFVASSFVFKYSLKKKNPEYFDVLNKEKKFNEQFSKQYYKGSMIINDKTRGKRQLYYRGQNVAAGFSLRKYKRRIP